MKNARRAQNGSLKNSLIITYLLMMGVLIGIAAILIVRLLWQFTDDEFERSSNHFAQQLQDNVDGQMLMIYELTQNMGSDTALWSSNLLKEESELLSAYNAIRRYSLSIDIADVDVGRNIGAQLQMDQAEADKRIAQAKAEERRALAVAREQEMIAYVQEMKGKVVEAEAEVPKAMAAALREGKLGVMDYYQMKNVEADTTMRESIAKVSAPPVNSEGKK